MTDYYILRPDGTIDRTSDVRVWGRYFEDADRHIGWTDVDGAQVSTVFLGLDHSFGSGPPLLFETLVIDGPMDGEMDRYSTLEEAKAGHARMVDRVAVAMRTSKALPPVEETEDGEKLPEEWPGREVR